MAGAVGKTMETNPQLSHMLTPFLPTWVAEAEDIADAVCWLASDDRGTSPPPRSPSTRAHPILMPT